MAWYGEFFPEVIRRGCCLYSLGPLTPKEVLREAQQPAYDLAVRIQKLLDPNGIMNPGFL